MTNVYSDIPLLTNYQHSQSKQTHTCSSICPTYDFLINEKITTNVTCIVSNCDEVFSNQSCLNFHLKKVHRIEQTKQIDEILLTRARSKSQKLQDNCDCKYYCPVEKCKFYFGNEHYLPTFHSLKNHFIRMHGNKTYSCTKCNRSFAIKSEMQRHAENCGVIYKCTTCGCPYATKNSLLKHLRKKNHTTNMNESKSLQTSVDNKTLQTNKLKRNIKIAPAKPVSSIQNSLSTSQGQSFILIPIDSNNNILSNDKEMQRSLGCQTQFDISNSITQEIACQTIQNCQNNQFCTPLDISSSFEPSNSISTSTDITFNTNFQSQETQTLNGSDCVVPSDEEYFNMILADISTQTQLNEFPSYSNQPSESFNSYRSCSIQTSEITLNTAYTQTNIYEQSQRNQTESSVGMISNLELANLDDEIYFGDQETNNLTNNYVSSSTSTDTFNYHLNDQQNYDASSSACQTSCQTDDYYFSSANTNSIQTQTYYFNEINVPVANSGDSRYTTTITQTDWNVVDQQNYQ